MAKRVVIKVYGRVQGVFFRQTTRKVARRLGLTGRVRNESDGSVYIEAEGPEHKLKELIEFSKKGPELAHVDRIEYELTDTKNTFHGFEYDF